MPKIQMRRDTSANWKSVNPTLLTGEWALETDTHKMKIGDGTTAYNSLAYFRDEDNEWQKPSDWIDLRSGALDNSVYFLVGHSADYSSYPKFSVGARVSTDANTYDVYVDGVKQATTASATATTLDWQTLALTSGRDVTHPAALRTHVVRVTPTVSTDTLTKISINPISGQRNQGCLWAHFELDNTIRCTHFAGTESSLASPLLEAVTAKDNKITLITSSDISESGFYSMFAHSSSLVQIPTLASDGEHESGGYLSFYGTKVKKLKLSNLKPNGLYFLANSKVERIETDKAIAFVSGIQSLNSVGILPTLKSLPPISNKKGQQVLIRNLTSLEDTFLDLSFDDTKKVVRVYGTSSAFCTGVKGLVVSNEAPFDGASPQINVSYTGLDRAALVNLFKSMPYNVGYTVVGSPTITNGVASGFSESNYLQLTQSINNSAPFEYVVCFTPNSVTAVSGTDGIAVARIADAFFHIGNSKLSVRYSIGSNKWITESTALSENTKYWGKLTYDGTEVGLSLSTDGINYTTPVLQQESPRDRADIVTLGYINTSYSALDGTIDLNNTYIKVNGVTLFRGAEAMTKTCSVVGCTGTADLTQDDKNIALNKGWSLTVA